MTELRSILVSEVCEPEAGDASDRVEEQIFGLGHLDGSKTVDRSQTWVQLDV